MFYEGYDLGPFEQNYCCYSASFIDKAHLEYGDKVIMPPSALDRLASLRIDYPMLFEVSNPTTSRDSHCGVLEFVAEEGMIYMPYWMMQNLLLQEGDIVKVKSATLPKGTYVKLQPHTQDFLDISNPKAVLETTLRNFSCLTVGDNIMVAYNNRKYYIDIVETKPASAISIIETDCEVDFAPPLDYNEPEKLVQTPKVTSKAPSEVSQDGQENQEAKFSAFSGTCRRLDGKLGAQSLPHFSHSETSHTASSASKIVTSSKNPPASSSKKQSGKLVFGVSNSNKPNSESISSKKEELKLNTVKQGSTKFQAFTGKYYSLRG